MINLLLVDLDDTVYPYTSGLWGAIGDRINLYMIERMHFPREEVDALRHRLFATYGTTMRGLVSEFNADQEEYLAFVHDVPLEEFIKPDPQIREVLQSVRQKKVIFTNADTRHARRVLQFLCLEDLFEQIIDIHDIAPYCKPQRGSFTIALEKAGAFSPETCMFLDDSINNLAAAKQLGIYTVRVGYTDCKPEYDQAIESLRDLPMVLKNHNGKRME
jgi:putative hydrolase of the HAD superfamily